MTKNRSVLAIPTNTSQEPKINIAGTHKFAFAPVRSAQPCGRSQTIHYEGWLFCLRKNWRSTLKEHVWVQMGVDYIRLIARGQIPRTSPNSLSSSLFFV
jgi:hypothetical protein